MGLRLRVTLLIGHTLKVSRCGTTIHISSAAAAKPFPTRGSRCAAASPTGRTQALRRTDDAIMNEVALEPLDARGVRMLRWNRPDKANAIDDALAGALEAALAQAHEEATRLLVITGNGRNFCGGFDFTGAAAMQESALGDRLIAVERALQRVRYERFVSVAVVNGAAFGAGADLALACTYRLGYDGARFRFPGFRFGVALGTRHLARTIGADRARRILLEDPILDADASLAIGLLTHRLGPAESAAFVAALARKLQALDGWSQAAILQATSADSGPRDMELLIESVRRPGFQERLARYQAHDQAGA